MILQLEQLESRICPSAPTYHGGFVLQNPKVATMFVGSVGSYQATADYAVTVAASDYTKILGVFGVQSASRNGRITVSDPGPLSNQQVGDLIKQEIAAGKLPQPTANQMYMVFLPHPVTDVNGGAYHSYTNYNGVPIVYMVCYTTGPSADPYGVFHEYSEAATDPLLTGWYGDDYTQEIADLANGSTFPLHGFSAAAVIAPSGNLITRPTAFVPLHLSPPPPSPAPQPTPQPAPTPVVTLPVNVNVPSFSDLFSWFEYELALWEQRLMALWMWELQANS